MKKYIAEGIGTFAIVFCGCGAMVIDAQSAGAITHLGVSITFGLIVMVMIYAFGNISGAHYNPAVTIAFSAVRIVPLKEIIPHIIAQTAGAFVGAALLHLVFPESKDLGCTIPSGAAWQSFVLEIILSYFLMLVIIFVSQGPKEGRIFAGAAIGATVLLEAQFAGPISGASMNPARSLAPAVLSGNLNSLWIYLSAPLLGTLLAAATWRVTGHKAAQ
jgi:aquaporin Z